MLSSLSVLEVVQELSSPLTSTARGRDNLAIELILIGQAVVEPSRSRAPSLPAVGCKGGRRQDRKSLLCDLRDNGHRPSDVRVSRDLPVVGEERR